MGCKVGDMSRSINVIHHIKKTKNHKISVGAEKPIDNKIQPSLNERKNTSHQFRNKRVFP